MEELFDKDITVINQYYDKETKSTKYKLSYVKGFWSSNDGISINGTHLIKQDGLSARILINDNRNPVYLDPERFQEMQEILTVRQVNEKTVQEINNSLVKLFSKPVIGYTLKNEDYLVKGKVTDFDSITNFLKEHKRDVMKITNIATKDYGSEDLWHFAIVGA